MNEQVRIRPAPTDFAFDAFTSDDFLQMMELGAFEDMRAELVGGVIEKMTPADGEHGTHNFQVAFKIAKALGDDAPIAIDLAVVIDGKTVRGIDIALGRGAIRRKTKGSDLLLAVEIADTTLGRDLGAKAVDYSRAGIETYWVVDLNSRVVHVMAQPGEEGYAERGIVRFGEPLAVPGADATIVIGEA